MNSHAQRPAYKRIALFTCFGVLLGVAVWRMAFASPSPIINDPSVAAQLDHN